jgi:hypothetical protein
MNGMKNTGHRTSDVINIFDEFEDVLEKLLWERLRLIECNLKRDHNANNFVAATDKDCIQIVSDSAEIYLGLVH